MDRNKLIRSDAYWSAKLNTLLYHKNYKGENKQKALIVELLTLKNELIEMYDNQKPAKNIKSEMVCKCPLCGENDMFIMELIHYKCRKCKETFTN